MNVLDATKAICKLDAEYLERVIAEVEAEIDSPKRIPLDPPQRRKSEA